MIYFNILLKPVVQTLMVFSDRHVYMFGFLSHYRVFEVTKSLKSCKVVI